MTTEVVQQRTAQAAAAKLSFVTLTAMVVGSMVGAGVFSLPRRFAQPRRASTARSIAWVIAGTGMLMLAFVFQTLAVRKPDLDAGVYAYAKAGFGEYLGFFSAFGYWASACVGNVTYWVLIMSTLGAAHPGARRRRHGHRRRCCPASASGCFYLLIRARREGGRDHQPDRDGRQARADPGVHRPRAVRLRSPTSSPTTGPAARRTGLALRAGPGHDARHGLRLPRRRGRERLLALRQAARGRRPGHRARLPQRAGRLRVGHDRVRTASCRRTRSPQLRQPSMAGVLESAVGHWGIVFISVGLIVSVLGAYLAWTPDGGRGAVRRPPRTTTCRRSSSAATPRTCPAPRC